ncbi:patatin-like phospholipase family protein [Polyangium spumosum]|uniref:Patatin-like phospholipase family protein n=1 Tax=Polyangium spumosum TaxID=889282 RepID=A0A6N7Q1L9_9BACT|nr:patatin-like phospholipase family protein [Polyangium spumosum]MRG97939.1 patatin-like phospholipase family protein [Polyangium spumosum]
MTRLKVAFVASGGAVRGLAHLGVLKACEELGILPEIYVGTSSGAIVCATYGQDIPLDVLLDAYRLPWRRRHRGPRLFPSSFIGLPTPGELLDPGHLASGIFSAARLERYLSRFLPINDFRKLPNPVFVTAVDIDTGERVVFGPGYEETTPVSQAVAASCCVPGIFRPFRIGDRYFVNGEVARTLSADVAIAAGADVVIISNVYKPEQTREGRRSLARRGPFPVLRQSLSVLLTEKERQGVELYGRLHPQVTFLDIAPELGPFSYLNRFAVRGLVLRGYRQALRVLAEAKEKGVFERTSKLSSPLN